MLFAVFGPLLGQQVTRGPYLQVGTPTSLIVRWRTDLSTNSVIRYGSSLESLNLTVEDLQLLTDHEVQITSLSPDTKYYYSIGTTSKTLTGGDTGHFFITSPTPGTSKPTRIWVIGDSGTKNDKARSVRDMYYNYTADQHTNVWLMLGDNAYRNGTDKEYQRAVFENMYEEMLRKTVLWPTLGNHDGKTFSSPGPHPYYDIFTLPKNGEAGGMASGTEAYYSFDYSNVHFICLNSTTRDLRHPKSAMWAWLEEDLAANHKDWTIAFWHHPPYSKGSHDSDSEGALIKMRQRALPRLEDAGVDLVLSGHSHSYERSFLLDGHYGDSSTLTEAMKINGGDGRTDGDEEYGKATLGPGSHEGTVYMVVGSSGKAKGGSLDHPIMIASLNVPGSVVLDIDGNKMDARFIDNQGNISDYFTMIKGSTVADFVASPQNGAAPLSVSFTDRSSDSITSYSWDFGDGKTSTLQNPSHTYTVADTYTVSLTLTGPGGSDTETKSDYIIVTSSKVINVPADYSTIQAAFNAASDGDTILVAPGIYQEAIEMANKSVILASWFLTTEDTSYISQTMLDGNGGNAVITIKSSVGPSTTIIGFTIQNATDGIFPFAKFDILNCRIRNTSDGIDYEAGSGGLCKFNVFENNSDDGIDLDDAVDIIIEENIIRNNGDDGIEIRLQPYNGPMLNYIIRNNEIYGNGEDGIQLIDYDTLSDRLFI
ncbi:MAG: metallophosphoesterase, partial [Bacteroidetes bacterium]|nr:metallophosphoesterase [Bacteroidota bacterium]